MVRAIAVAAWLVGWTAPVRAQPGMTPPIDRPTPSSARLSAEEAAILARGEISEGEHLGGGLVGTFTGFGLGHAVQGRFVDRGWIFLVGEAVSIAAAVTFAVRCAESSSINCEEEAGWLFAGVVGTIGFRVWEVIDVWRGPALHNARVRELRARLRGIDCGVTIQPAARDGKVHGATAGLELRF